MCAVMALRAVMHCALDMDLMTSRNWTVGSRKQCGGVVAGAQSREIYVYRKRLGAGRQLS